MPLVPNSENTSTRPPMAPVVLLRPRVPAPPDRVTLVAAGITAAARCGRTCHAILMLSVASAMRRYPSTSTPCSLKPSPPFRAAARQDVAEAVNRANTCVGQKDDACGETAVASVQALTLSDDERGLLAITRAELAMLREDSGTAVAIFREVRALPELSDPLQREITWRLALLHNSRAEFAETLRLSASIGCDKWTPEA